MGIKLFDESPKIYSFETASFIIVLILNVLLIIGTAGYILSRKNWSKVDTELDDWVGGGIDDAGRRDQLPVFGLHKQVQSGDVEGRRDAGQGTLKAGASDMESQRTDPLLSANSKMNGHNAVNERESDSSDEDKINGSQLHQ